MKLTLEIWRQKNASDPGRFARYQVEANEHMSFLEMLDVLNQDLITKGEEPVAFDSDCREGICGMCGFLINGSPHGPVHGATVCQLHMRHFKDGDQLTLEPWRAAALPILKDLVVNRTAFDRIIQAGGYISTRTGSAPEANSILVPKEAADRAMEAAACIGCGACVAACPNASAALFTSAKIAHLGLLPQGQPERYDRVLSHGGAGGRRGLRPLHAHGRVRGGLPGARAARGHPAHEPRLPQGQPEEARPQGRRRRGVSAGRPRRAPL